MWLTILLRCAVVVIAVAILLNGCLSIMLHSGDPLSENIRRGLHGLFSIAIWIVLSILFVVELVRSGTSSHMKPRTCFAFGGIFAAGALAAFAVTLHLYQENLSSFDLRDVICWASLLPATMLSLIVWLEWKVPAPPLVGYALSLFVVIFGFVLSWRELWSLVVPGLD